MKLGKVRSWEGEEVLYDGRCCTFVDYQGQTEPGGKGPGKRRGGHGSRDVKGREGRQRRGREEANLRSSDLELWSKQDVRQQERMSHLCVNTGRSEGADLRHSRLLVERGQGQLARSLLDNCRVDTRRTRKLVADYLRGGAEGVSRDRGCLRRRSEQGGTDRLSESR